MYNWVTEEERRKDMWPSETMGWNHFPCFFFLFSPAFETSAFFFFFRNEDVKNNTSAVKQWADQPDTDWEQPCWYYYLYRLMFIGTESPWLVLLQLMRVKCSAEEEAAEVFTTTAAKKKKNTITVKYVGRSRAEEMSGTDWRLLFAWDNTLWTLTLKAFWPLWPAVL